MESRVFKKISLHFGAKTTYTALNLGASNEIVPQGFRLEAKSRGSIIVVSALSDIIVLRNYIVFIEIDFIKRVDKGRITTVKDLES